MSDILNPGLGVFAVDTVSMSPWRKWPSIINGMLGLSQVGWTYYEGILNRHIWWCLWKNIHMTLRNPFAIHQNFHLQMSNFRKSCQMTRTYRIIYTFTIIYLSNTWLPYQLGPRLHLRPSGKWCFFFGEDIHTSNHQSFGSRDAERIEQWV